MTLTRRQTQSFLLATMAAAGLSACGDKKIDADKTMKEMSHLEPLAGLGLIVVKDGKRILEHVEGFASGLDRSESGPRRTFTFNSPFRLASMSKVVTLLTAINMERAGVLDLDVDISAALGQRLRHPDYPDTPVTLRHLLAHRSGISDPSIYWTEAAGDIRDLLSPEIFKAGQPGAWFEYANLNYGIAATVMEVISGERFDVLTRRYVLDPLGLDAGFNWAGVSRDKRRMGATLYRKVEGAMRIQVDGTHALIDDEPVFVGDAPFSLNDYEPGKNGTLLSPQGGLRASLDDLLIIAQALADYPGLHTAIRIDDGANGKVEDGHFVSFGPGLYVYPPDLSPIPGQLMIGHHGEAYGMYGGLWHLPQINAQIVHTVTATPEPPRAYHSGPPAIPSESRILLDKAIVSLGLKL